MLFDGDTKNLKKEEELKDQQDTLKIKDQYLLIIKAEMVIL